jgi:hypothetical protein
VAIHNKGTAWRYTPCTNSGRTPPPSSSHGRSGVLTARLATKTVQSQRRKIERGSRHKSGSEAWSEPRTGPNRAMHLEGTASKSAPCKKNGRRPRPRSNQGRSVAPQSRPDPCLFILSMLRFCQRQTRQALTSSKRLRTLGEPAHPGNGGKRSKRPAAQHRHRRLGGKSQGLTWPWTSKGQATNGAPWKRHGKTQRPSRNGGYAPSQADLSQDGYGRISHSDTQTFKPE